MGRNNTILAHFMAERSAAVAKPSDHSPPSTFSQKLAAFIERDGKRLYTQECVFSSDFIRAHKAGAQPLSVLLEKSVEALKTRGCDRNQVLINNEIVSSEHDDRCVKCKALAEIESALHSGREGEK